MRILLAILFTSFSTLIALQPVLSETEKPGAFESKVVNSIHEQIAQIPDLGAHEITVSNYAGVVTLSGSVQTENLRTRVEQVARNNQGVERVVNQLKVMPLQVSVIQKRVEYTPTPVSDADVKANLLNAIRAEDSALASGVALNVENGVVTLSGSKPTFRDIDRILSIALMIDGVKDIHSELTTNGSPYPVDRFSKTR